MKALYIVWPAVSLILIIAGLITIVPRHERDSKKGKIGYILLTLGSFRYLITVHFTSSFGHKNNNFDRPLAILNKEVIHDHNVLERPAIFVVFEPVCGYQCVVYCAFLRKGLFERIESRCHYPLIGMAYYILVIVEFHFAHINDIVLSLNEKVYLTALDVIGAFHRPSRLPACDS